MNGGRGRRRLEARVELDDELFVDARLHLVAGGQTVDSGTEVLGIKGEPAGNVAHAVFLEVARGHLARSGHVFDFDDVAGQDVVADNVDLVVVDADVAVIDKLACGGAAPGQAKEVNHAVEARLKQLEKALAGDAAFFLGDGEDAAELALEQAINIAELLLFVKANAVFGVLAAGLGAVLAGWIRAAFVSLGCAENGLAKTTADASGRSDIASHGG